MNTFTPTRFAMTSRLVALIGALAIGAGSSLHAADPQTDLTGAKSALITGRDYLVGFPKEKTRNGLRKSFLAVDDNGVPVATATPKPNLLRDAITQATSVRDNPNATPSQDFVAQLVAWEALEALLNGELVAGNASLLRGLRVAFPTATGDGEKPGGESDLPVGTPAAANGQEYTGANLKDLAYARAYFLEGISSALDFIATDSTGEIRATGKLGTPFPQYTEFNTTDLPDANFMGVQNMQTTGYLLGNALDRYGKAVVSMGDRLWRAAYFDRQRAPGGPRAGERQEMLNKAVEELRRGAHAQFMAVLPLAAELPEGELGFELSRLDQVRVTTATAAALIDRIRRGEQPKLENLALNSATTDIAQQLALVNQLRNTVAGKYGTAQAALWRKKDAENQLIQQAADLKVGFTEQLRAAVNLDPGAEGQAPYFGLRNVTGRENFRHDLYAKIDRMLKAPADSAELTDGSELGQAILGLRRAGADVESAKNRVASIPQQILIEQQRNKLVNDVTIGTAEKVSAYQVAMGFANMVSVSVNASVSCGFPKGCDFTSGVSVSINPGALISAELQAAINLEQAISTIKINNINMEALVRNKLLEARQLTVDLQASAAQAQLAGAGVKALLARVDRLMENHLYYQQANGQKWYSDSAIIFEQEKTEEDYQIALNEYVRELYVLSQKLAVRWSEAFQNPYLKADGVAETLGGGLFDSFTQPESIFAVYQHTEADNFLLALQEWDLKLRGARTGGQADIQSRISLRQDIFGFSDVVYNSIAQRFETNPDAAARELNKRRFRALLLRSAEPADSRYWLRLEFPIAYGQLARRVTGNLVSQPQLILASRSDWNIRLTEFSARVIGQNVAQDSFNTLRLDLYQYGRIEIPTYHPRQAAVYPNFLTFNLPLYYPDPEEASVSAFKFSLNAGINGAAGTPNPFVPQTEPTPFCNRWVLLIERQANPPINLQNIDDIELTMKSRSSIPPQFFN